MVLGVERCAQACVPNQNRKITPKAKEKEKGKRKEKEKKATRERRAKKQNRDVCVRFARFVCFVRACVCYVHLQRRRLRDAPGSCSSHHDTLTMTTLCAA